METSRTMVSRRRWEAAVGVAGLGLILFSFGACSRPASVSEDASTSPAAPAAAADIQVPTYELDPSFPQPLPNNWTLGETWGVTVDSRDHIWVSHNSDSQSNNPPGQVGDIYQVVGKEGKILAPVIVEFDPDGNVVQSWGRPVGAPWPEGSDWNVHGLWADKNDDIWIAGNGHVVVKYSNKGKFLLQIGKLWYKGGSNDQQLLGRPTSMGTDQDGQEVYIADGYQNQRVAVFDATTGAYRRHFGAYGKPIDVTRDGQDHCGEKHNKECAYGQTMAQRAKSIDPPPDFWTHVHCARVSNDGFVYVCDRSHSRIQVFKTDGTYVNEVFLDKDVRAKWDWDFENKKYRPYPARDEDSAGAYGGGDSRGIGSTSNAALSRDPENKYLIVGGSPSYRRVYILERKTLRLLDTIDTESSAHEIAVDSKMNIYMVGGRGRDVRRLRFTGMRPLE